MRAASLQVVQRCNTTANRGSAYSLFVLQGRRPPPLAWIRKGASRGTLFSRWGHGTSRQWAGLPRSR